MTDDLRICAICRCEPDRLSNQTGEIMSLHVDHDHETGMVRGLLCANCNSGIGLLKDNVDSLHRAIEYLQKAD